MTTPESNPVFQVVGHTPWDELETMLREVPLLNQPNTRPYVKASISIERFRLSELSSTTRYILEELVAVQGLIRASLLPQGYDQLDLREGGLVLDSGKGPKRIIPPIVERYEADGDSKYIIDGSHRAHLARQVGMQADQDDPELTVVYVRDGITHPPYAFTNPWEEVTAVAERPEDKALWKNYRDFDRRYELYRDYSHIYDSAPRGLDPSSQ